jgi:hypothetical protein
MLSYFFFPKNELQLFCVWKFDQSENGRYSTNENELVFLKSGRWVS